MNGKYRFEADLASQLSVLPSYTALGMASLLPHQTLAYKPRAKSWWTANRVLAPQRNDILAAVEGVAVKGEDLMAMKRDEGREFVREKMVVYVYHNTVDATGDYAPTEGNTFEAVRRAIDEIADLVGHIINNLNGSQVLITADHGFLFPESAPERDRQEQADGQAGGHGHREEAILLGHKLPDTTAPGTGYVR